MGTALGGDFVKSSRLLRMAMEIEAFATEGTFTASAITCMEPVTISSLRIYLYLISDLSCKAYMVIRVIFQWSVILT